MPYTIVCNYCGRSFTGPTESRARKSLARHLGWCIKRKEGIVVGVGGKKYRIKSTWANRAKIVQFSKTLGGYSNSVAEAIFAGYVAGMVDGIRADAMKPVVTVEGS